MSGTFWHQPVLLQEVIEALTPRSGGLYVDGTMGGAGHSRAILAASAPDGRLIAIDQDDEAIAAGSLVLASFAERTRIVKANFAQLQQVVQEVGWGAPQGILLDIGVSSHQLDEPERGFSYMQDAPLDMRMDRSQPFSARELVNSYDAAQLTEIIYKYGEEKWAKRIAQMIVEARKQEPLERTSQLVRAVKAAIPQGAREKDQHPAKRTFQAIRIAVNDELAVLERAIEAAASALAPGGRLAVITFHSLEDRIVKDRFRLLATDCICPPKTPICICGHKASVRLVNRKPIIPTDEEIEANPRARSAKLRVAEKL
jgi:16S rRNA (cytosine1402-N4)-methyltransferase